MLALLIGAVLTSCVDSNSDIDTTWRDANLKFYQEQMQLKDANGNPYYKLIVAPWDANAQVLVHWYRRESLAALLLYGRCEISPHHVRRHS